MNSAHFILITLFPEYFDVFKSGGVLSAAFKNNFAKLTCINPREFTEDVHRSVDDRPFGGGDGMIMSVSPLEKSIDSAKTVSPNAVTIYLSPQGKKINKQYLDELAGKDLILVCGRYGGIDQRIINTKIDFELSIGDYVTSGGEIPALVLLDCLVRRIPGVLGNHSSFRSDSFENDLLEAPQFTKPRDSELGKVPAVLLSGNHLEIQKWRDALSVLVTISKRPEIIESLLSRNSHHNPHNSTHNSQQNLIAGASNVWSRMSPSEKQEVGLFENQEKIDRFFKEYNRKFGIKNE